MFYLTTHSTHYIYGCCHQLMGYSFQLAARVLLYSPSHRQDNTYHGICYTSLSVLVINITEVIRKRKEMPYLMTHSTHFYLWLYGIRHMVKDHSDSEKEKPLPSHGLLFPISSKGSFICTIPQTG